MCKISIIIPAYNSSQYLKECINSCLHQTFEDYEIIVLNDGSTDDTIYIMNSILKNSEKIILVSKDKNEGLVCARQTALKYAKGEFVFFVDADDTIEPDTLQRLVAVSEESDIVIGGILIESMQKKQYPIQHKLCFKYGADKKGLLCNYLVKSITPSLCGRLIRKEYLVGIGTPLGVTIGEDVITNLLLLNKYDLRIKLVNDYFYHYIQYPSSMLNSKNRNSLYKRLEYMHWVCDFVNRMDFAREMQVNECLSHLLLEELYAFLRDGGELDMDADFINLIFSRYWITGVAKSLPFWQYSILYLYRLCPSIGKLSKKTFVLFRSVLYYFKLK